MPSPRLAGSQRTAHPTDAVTTQFDYDVQDNVVAQNVTGQGLWQTTLRSYSFDDFDYDIIE